MSSASGRVLGHRFFLSGRDEKKCPRRFLGHVIYRATFGFGSGCCSR